jgi:predicted enzyme related to lactoylglutathione lyase
VKNLDNTINYIEFPARDLDRTKDFYTRAFGWKFVDYGPNYASFEGAGIDGGFTVDSNPSTSSGVLVVLYNAKLEETETRIRALGGEIVRPIFTFPGGRRFHFTDPSGNEVAIWSE